MPAGIWVILEGLLFLRLLLPQFPSLPFSVWGTKQVGLVYATTPAISKGLFARVNPWIIFLLLCWGAVSYLLLKRKTRYEAEEEHLYYHDGEEAFVVGFFSPKIFLPFEKEKRNQELLLLHERMHIKRKDPQILLLSYVALCFNWYNPFAWILFFRMRLDMDLACDEAVLQTGVDPKEYAKLLLEKSSVNHLLALGIRWLTVKDRIKQMNRKKAPKLVVLALLLLMTIVLLPFLSGPKIEVVEEKSLKTMEEKEQQAANPVSEMEEEVAKVKIPEEKMIYATARLAENQQRTAALQQKLAYLKNEEGVVVTFDGIEVRDSSVLDKADLDVTISEDQYKKQQEIIVIEVKLDQLEKDREKIEETIRRTP